jgi:hypothetical protein
MARTSLRPKAIASSPRSSSVGGGRGAIAGGAQAEQLGLHHRVVVQPASLVVQQHVGAGAGRHVAGRHHVIEVRVRVHDLDRAQAGARERGEESRRLVARIDDQRLAGSPGS